MSLIRLRDPMVSKRALTSTLFAIDGIVRARTRTAVFAVTSRYIVTRGARITASAERLADISFAIDRVVGTRT